ncbi:hypothetical protein [Neorhizobium alkalisoli]|uniref:Uncharacterized protein n=1 Tax=Neorhizobium alkalisoli TaxID=528178 RepID=A0A561QGK9_9HYPH|nr:hypothetical protein [Neorhizobium alkalisoli]TWF49476.1 hypothetical protein FHW37_108146 [Neorhizobium alkalisoli]
MLQIENPCADFPASRLRKNSRRRPTPVAKSAFLNLFAGQSPRKRCIAERHGLAVHIRQADDAQFDLRKIIESITSHEESMAAARIAGARTA